MNKKREAKGGTFPKPRVAVPENGSGHAFADAPKNGNTRPSAPASITPDAPHILESAHGTPAAHERGSGAALHVVHAAPASLASVMEQPVLASEDAPTLLGVLVALIWYPVTNLLGSTEWLPDNLFADRLSIRTWSLWSRIYRFLRPYAWTVLPLVVILALQMNTHMYYNVFYGYDMPPQFNNMYSVLQTGAMPADVGGGNYEAFQAPLYYILTAWVIRVGNLFSNDSMMHVMPIALLAAAMLWTLLAAVLIQRIMHRAHWVWRALTLAVIMLFPMNVELSVMFNNDLPLTAFGFWGVMTLWLMVRSGRLLDRALWIRAAAIIGICIAFKANGSILVPVYVLLAVYAVGLYVREHRLTLAARIIRYSLMGMPLMLAPLVVNMWHTSHYGTNAMGSQSQQYNVFSAQSIQFFTSFDTTIFSNPYNNGLGTRWSGEGSFWTQQYATLHSDYLHFWFTDAYRSWPSSAMLPAPLDLWPLEGFNTAIILQYMAIPVTLVMVFGFIYALYRTVRWPRLALREGSAVVVLVTVISEGALLAAFYDYADVHLVIIQARHLGFLYPFLFVVGMFYLWKHVLHRRSLFSLLLSGFLSLNMVAYSYFALKLMWLPPYP